MRNTIMMKTRKCRPNDEGQYEVDASRELDDLNEESITKTFVESSTKNRTEEIEEKRSTPTLKRKLTGKVEKAKFKVSKHEKSETEEEELKTLQVIKTKVNVRSLVNLIKSNFFLQNMKF